MQCVVSKFRMYFRALESERGEKKQQQWRRNGELEVWEGNEQKVRDLIILGSVCLAQCLTNLSRLLRVYMGGE